MGSTGRIATILLAVFIMSATAALFGPAEPWNGLDVGAIGASVFTLNLGAVIWLFSVRGREVFPGHMSVTEQRAWVGSLFLSIIFITFVREMVALSGHAVVPDRIADLFAHRFIQRYIVLAIAWAVISHLLGRQADVEVDERDLRMRHRADRAADWALTLIVIAAIVVLASYPREFLAWWLTPIVLANVLIGVLSLKTLVEHLVLALSYRSRTIAHQA